MTKSSQLMDDIAQLAGGAAGLLSGVQQQIRDDIKARVEEMATRLDLVPREDFERVEALLEKALAEQKELKARLDALEKKNK
ncbi:MAG TPA: accessory factor UbiK family protein [Alphaproteobacteria bacterium]|nr:accessory factor UbiK family protein [Alphaproteobacteria bacterium]